METSNFNNSNPSVKDTSQNKANGVNKKTLLLGVLALIVILIVGLIITKQGDSDTKAKRQLQEKYQTIKSQYEQAKAKGYDVSDAERLGKEAMQAYDKKEYKKASELLNQAIDFLKNLKQDGRLCVQVITYAKSTEDECKSFSTPCDIPEGWSVVDNCGPEGSPLPDVKVETNCTDNIDNDSDGLADNKDGDCWVRAGAIFSEEWRYPATYSDFKNILPELRDIGIKTIEMFGINEHCKSAKPGFRWSVRDYSNPDPARGSEYELDKLIEEIHGSDMKTVLLMQSTITCAPQEDLCNGAESYDDDGIGGELYRRQINNPEEQILIKDQNGNYACHYYGWGYSVNRSSPSSINFLSDWFKNSVQARNIDGLWLDSPIDNYCFSGETLDCGKRQCPDPVPKGDYSSLNLFRVLQKIKTKDQIFIGEQPSTKTSKSDWQCNFPYYPAPDMDEVAEISQDGSLMLLLRSRILKGSLNSTDFVQWINDRPIQYNRQRVNLYRYITTTDQETLGFVAKDKKYLAVVALLSTIPGVPQVSYYELFGAPEIPDSVQTAKERRDYWSKVLNIRNSNNALKYGDIKNVWKSGDNIYAYSRTYENETVIIAINFSSKAAVSILSLPFKKGTILHDEINNEGFTVNDPVSFNISVPAYGARILIIKR